MSDDMEQLELDGLLRAEADARVELHKDNPLRRPLSDGYELVGITGEAEFATRAEQPPNWHRRRGGDGGVDFIVPLRYTIDVKTFRKPIHLICEPGKIRANIFVLAEYFDVGQRAALLGWEWGVVLGQAPVRDFGGILNHYIHRDGLRSIDELLSRIMKLR